MFRNFVFSVPGVASRHVRAIEILAGNKRVVHHANVIVDRTGASRRRDEADPEVGFAGMDVEIASDRFEPDSHFLFWKPGTPPTLEPDDMAWRIDRGTDLVLNVHLQPSGKPERLQPSIGLYFTDRAPTRFPMLLQLEHDGALDIAPGVRDFEITDSYTVPVDVELLAVYPHAHYLGQGSRRRGRAAGRDAADADPHPGLGLELAGRVPAGVAALPAEGLGRVDALSVRQLRATTHETRIGRRAGSLPGNRSSDEMGHLWIQVVPKTPRRLESPPGSAHAPAPAEVPGRLRRACEPGSHAPVDGTPG